MTSTQMQSKTTYEFSNINDSTTDEELHYGQPVPPKKNKSAKQMYINYLKDNNIVTEAHYSFALANGNELLQLEQAMNPNMIKQARALVMRTLTSQNKRKYLETAMEDWESLPHMACHSCHGITKCALGHIMDI